MFVRLYNYHLSKPDAIPMRQAQSLDRTLPSFPLILPIIHLIPRLVEPTRLQTESQHPSLSHSPFSGPNQPASRDPFNQTKQNKQTKRAVRTYIRFLLPNLLPKLVAPDPMIPLPARHRIVRIPALRRRAGDMRLGAAAGREAVLDVLHAGRAEEARERVQVCVLEEA